jgi:Tol biopolymer transport system component
MRSTSRALSRLLVAAGATLAFGVLVPTAQAVTPTTERVSIDSGSGGGRELPAVSSDGTRVVFVGRGESNQGVWLRDLTAGETYRLTNGSHFNPAISGDGNTVAYVIYGSNRQIFLRDITDPLNVGPQVRVDRSTAGAASDGLSDFPSLNEDGTLVAFHSTASNLDPLTPLPTSGGPNKVYLRDVTAETTVMLSVDIAGIAPPGNAIKPDISPDGRYVAFASEQVLTTEVTLAPVMLAKPAAPGGDEGDETTETFQQIYVIDRTAGTIAVASVSSDEVLGNGASALVYGPTVSDDGTLVAFESDATNLDETDVNGVTDAFVRDLVAGTTTRMSERPAFQEFGPLVPVSPVRLVDTRTTKTLLGPGDSITVMVRGKNGVPETASAAAINLTAVSDTAYGYMTVYPTGEQRPLASSLNLAPGAVDTNAVTVKIGADGSVTVFNSHGDTHVIVDLNGYYDHAIDISLDGGGFTAMAPTRLLDTRTTSTPIRPGETLVLPIAGTAGVPVTATAAALNVTAVAPTAPGFLTVYPSLETKPLASNLNFAPGQVVANSVIAKLGTNGAVSIYNPYGNTDVVVDLNGYFDAAEHHGGLTAVTPSRLLDTRTANDPLGPMETVELTVIDVGGVPADNVTAVVLNVTATLPTAPSYLTVYPSGAERPLASNLNFIPGETQPNQVFAAVGDDGKVVVFNRWGDVHVVVDVMAYFTSIPLPEGGLGPAVTGDGTAVAFESSAPLTDDDLNGVNDAYLYLIDTATLERLSVAIEGGTEATGTRVDGHTGEVVPTNNGVDVSVGTTANAIAFVSNGDLAADRPIGEENPDEISTEPASFMRLR